MIPEWDLTATNLRRLRLRRYNVAVLPCGTVEAHNLHLPEGLDVRHATYIAQRCCAAAWTESPTVVCLPPIPFGVDCNLMAFPLTLHVRQATLDALLRDLVTSLAQHGVTNVVLLNGHGGNDFIPFIRQIQSELPVRVFNCNWWTVGADQYGDIFSAPDDHAGEMETSVALAICPELVELEHAGDGATPASPLEAVRRGWVRTSRDFSRGNDHCGAGDPRAASAEKGRRYLDLVCERITRFLVELARGAGTAGDAGQVPPARA